jgi:phage tail tube protein FII
MFVKLAGPVLADTVRVDGVIVAEDVKLSLPEVSPLTSEYATAGGTVELPITGKWESMEATITSVGVNRNLGILASPKTKVIEIRGASDIVDTDGVKKNSGFKAFLRAVGKGFPGLELEPGGDAPENEITLAATRYQLFVDGEEVILIDQLTGDVRFVGEDFSASVKAYL